MTPESDYKTIPLTQEQVAIVDTEDFEELSHLKWAAHWDPTGRRYYATHCLYLGWKDGHAISKNLIMHRLIMGLARGDRRQVDHINHNALDNRKQNLRIVTQGQNAMNKRLYKNNTSGHKGVHWYKRQNRWIAYITAGGKRKTLGYFVAFEDACNCYREAVKVLHGEFQCLKGSSVNGNGSMD
jgi:hypothetical protein